MKVNVTKAELKSALTAVIKAVPSRTVLPILECVLIEAGDSVTVTGCDKETTIKCDVDGVVLESGKVCVDAKMLTEFVSKVSGSEILIKTENDTVEISCGKSTLTLGLQDAEQYPDIPKYEIKSEFEIKKSIIDSMIIRAGFAVDINNPRKEFTAGCLTVKNGDLTLMGLNSFCFAVISSYVETPDFSVLINYKALQNLSKISGDNIKVTIADNFTLFTVNNCKMLVRNMTGNFPNLDTILKAEHTCKLNITPSEFYGAVDRASIAIRNSAKVIPVVMTVNADSCSIAATTSIGKAHEEFEVAKEGECDSSIGIDASYLLSALGAIYEDDAEMCISGGKMPVIIKGSDYTFVIMPVTI